MGFLYFLKHWIYGKVSNLDVEQKNEFLAKMHESPQKIGKDSNIYRYIEALEISKNLQ